MKVPVDLSASRGGIALAASILASLLFLCLPFLQAIDVGVINPPPAIPVAPVEHHPKPVTEPTPTGTLSTPDRPPHQVPEPPKDPPLPAIQEVNLDPLAPSTPAGSALAWLPPQRTWETMDDWTALDHAPTPLRQPAPRVNRRHSDATVRVRLYVAETGEVVKAWIESSSDPTLEAAVLQAVRRWVFEPGMKNGQAVPFTMIQSFNFQN